jgi:hypothetical protein
MTTADPAFDTEAMEATLALCDAVTRTVRIAHALIESGQPVDLTGLDRGVGLLCAKSLDLPPSMGRALRPRLVAVLQTLDEMTLAMGRDNPG